MEHIHNWREAEVAYSLLLTFKQYGIDIVEEPKVIKLKREIRRFTNLPVNRDRIISDNGLDGYTELVWLPDDLDSKSEEVAEAWFKTYRELQLAPCAYDCTGGAFTIHHKLARRHGKWIVYHMVGFDL